MSKKDPGSHPLYDYLFHYNPYTELWTAFKREDKENYFNGDNPRKEDMISCKNIQDLIRYITTTQTNGGKQE